MPVQWCAHCETFQAGGKSRQSELAVLAHLSRVCITGGTALLYLRGGTSRAAAVAAGALLSAGALATRWSVFRAGFDSAADPKYTVGPQRAAIERGERRGAARTGRRE